MGSMSKQNAEPSPSTVFDTVQSTSVEIGGKTYFIRFDQSEITPRLSRKLNRAEVGEEATDEERAVARASADDTAIEYITTIVTAWDVTDRAGNLVPLTPDGVSGLSYKAINGVLRSINSPNAPAATDSANVESPD